MSHRCKAVAPALLKPRGSAPGTKKTPGPGGRDAPRKGPPRPPNLSAAAISGGRIGKAQLRPTRRESYEKAARCPPPIPPRTHRSFARVPARVRGA
uniref:Uncharacterized protein n=1 Tax=Setaria viridis TaxID=4556 RepID=A0A4U6TCF8_SETVI|nr:hypothetical protein SEVIR_9G560550v2 [Setaria viridis]